MASSTLAKKLGIKPGMRALIIGAPDDYTALLAPLPDNVMLTHAINGREEFAQLFITHKSEIRKSVPPLLKHASSSTLVWIAYPKKTSGMATDLSRDEVRDAVAEFGWHSVSIVSIDDTWSSLRFRPAEAIKPTRPSRS
jgi:hypothetical protein